MNNYNTLNARIRVVIFFVVLAIPFLRARMVLVENIGNIYLWLSLSSNNIAQRSDTLQIAANAYRKLVNKSMKSSDDNLLPRCISPMPLINAQHHKRYSDIFGTLFWIEASLTMKDLDSGYYPMSLPPNSTVSDTGQMEMNWNPKLWHLRIDSSPAKVEIHDSSLSISTEKLDPEEWIIYEYNTPVNLHYWDKVLLSINANENTKFSFQFDDNRYIDYHLGNNQRKEYEIMHGMQQIKYIYILLSEVFLVVRVFS